MLKSCQSCSYIGAVGESVCPFCKSDLAFESNDPQPVSAVRTSGLRGLVKTSTRYLRPFAFTLLACVAFSACAVPSDGPATSGASFGSLGSQNMSDYYYHKDAGWTYVYKNVERIYNRDGDVTSELRGANDTVRTMGFDGFAPSGDSLFRVAVSYRVRSTYAGRPLMDMFYVGQNGLRDGGFVDGDASQISGVHNMSNRPRPISTDTILAGVAGRIRTVCDDFTNQASSVWQTDTLWFCASGDSVYIWERFPGQTTLSRSRLLFCRDFSHNVNWCYDLIWQDTYFRVKDPDQQLTVPQGSFNHCVKIDVYTPEIDDVTPTSETKWFAAGTGLVKQHDYWNVTTDGYHFNKQDYTHALISLSHN